MHYVECGTMTCSDCVKRLGHSLWFTYAFWQIVCIPRLYASYFEDGHDDDWNILVMNRMWQTHSTFVHLLVLLHKLKNDKATFFLSQPYNLILQTTSYGLKMNNENPLNYSVLNTVLVHYMPTCIHKYTLYCIIIIIISNLSNDRSKAFSKTIPPHSAI